MLDISKELVAIANGVYVVGRHKHVLTIAARELEDARDVLRTLEFSLPGNACPICQGRENVQDPFRPFVHGGWCSLRRAIS